MCEALNEDIMAFQLISDFESFIILFFKPNPVDQSQISIFAV